MNEITTIITCMTDGEQTFLPEAILSVKNQTASSELVICVQENNAWINEYKAIFPKTSRILKLPLNPPGSTRNAAIERVNTPYFAFLDGDDSWKPDKLEVQLRTLRSTGLQLIGCKHVLINEQSIPFYFAPARKMALPSTWLGKTEIFQRCKFKNLKRGSDYVLWNELIRSQIPIGIQKKYLMNYRIRSNSVSQAFGPYKKKQTIANLSRITPARYLFLAASFVAHLSDRACSAVKVAT